MIEEGSPFPSFSLPNQDGKTVALADLVGQKAVIFFYPKDMTSGCTVEACEFTEALPDFGNIPVYGVSPDAPKRHLKFIEKENLRMDLLSDEDHKLLTDCGIWVEKSMYGRKYMGVERTTVLLDAKGVVLQVWRKVKPAGHAQEVLKASQA
jgi:peroxiredoxin Q/BCP